MTDLAVSASATIPSASELDSEGGYGTVLVVPLAQGGDPRQAAPVDFDLGFVEMSGFNGRPGQAVSVPARLPGSGSGGEAAATLVLAGCGEAGLSGPRGRESQLVERLRRATASARRSASRAASLLIDLRSLEVATRHPRWCAQAAVEGALLAAYRFDELKSDSEQPPQLTRLTVVSNDVDEADRGARRGERISRAVSLARDLANRPASALTPARLAEECEAIAGEAGLRVEVLDEKSIAAERLGALLGVSLGSSQPPRLIKLVFDPPSAPEMAGGIPTVALVGKGITFDSGGLSLKSPESMMVQKTDMSGAAAVLAAMSTLRDLDMKIRVVGLLPATENMPGPGALKPGDVVTARNGKTIEVLNTDAEGRLVLSDALSLAVEESPAAVVDVATLTGACVVALGRGMAGLMGNHDGFVDQVRTAGSVAGELAWPLPLPEDYRSSIDSDVADVKNIGAPGQAGAIAGGLLLQEFVGGVPWAHLDIAGPARSDKDDAYVRKGATGFGTRLLIELLSTFEVPPQQGEG